MLVQRHDCRECLSAVGTADLLSAVGVHPLVSTEVRELGVGLAADSAAERLDTAVNVLVLFQAAGRREVLAALRTSKSTFRAPLHRGRGSKERPRAPVERDRAVGFFVWKETAVKVKRMTWRERLAVWRRAYQVDRRRSTTTCYLQPQTKNISNVMFGTRWPSGTVPDFVRSRGRRFESRPWLLCTNANSACHPSGVG